MVQRSGSISDSLRTDQQTEPKLGSICQRHAALFDAVYTNADGDASRVPWSEGRASPLLVSWLNKEAPRLVRTGSRSVVVGCGLGDDVVALAERGYDVVGFDCSPLATRWASRRHPSYADRFLTADLLEIPARMHGRFDLVVENCTLQTLDPDERDAAIGALARLVTPRGIILTIGRARGEHEPLHREDGPPWPLNASELQTLASSCGLVCRCGPRIEHDDQHPPGEYLVSVMCKG
jgi:SAM-dependent methyltransferase